MGFFEGLEENIREASNAALIKSVVCDPDQTVGEILGALESEEDAKYLLEAFKELTIGQIVNAALHEIQALGQQAINEAEGAEEDIEEDIEEDVEEEDEAEDEAEDEVEAQPAKPRGKKKSPPPRAGSNGSSDEAIDLSSPDQRKAYESLIIKTLKSGKHVDEDSGVTSKELREVVGGDASQAREILNELIEAGRVAFYGKARGMRYYLFA